MSKVRAFLDENEYPHKDRVISLYDRLNRIDAYLMRKKGGKTLEVCYAFKMDVVNIGDRLKSSGPVAYSVDVEAMRKLYLLRKPCEAVDVDYALLVHDLKDLAEVAAFGRLVRTEDVI